LDGEKTFALFACKNRASPIPSIRTSVLSIENPPDNQDCKPCQLPFFNSTAECRACRRRHRAHLGIVKNQKNRLVNRCFEQTNQLELYMEWVHPNTA
jgi:hypothetical protein